MCGIVAYTGRKNCRQILMDGLKRLEYRGYDSAGIAITGGAEKTPLLEVVKEAGKIRELEAQLERSQCRRALRDRPYPMGYPRGTQQGKRPSSSGLQRQDCGGA
ncbi:MAG: hypothetical protein U5N58_03805 [Actinomycetota bacterium]|nr:hypothetical protein [Actinomycetota bacterium]